MEYQRALTQHDLPLQALKNLLMKAKTEFEDLQSQFRRDLKELGKWKRKEAIDPLNRI